MPVADGIYWERIAGPADAQTVLLSPGLGGSASFWAPQIADLTRDFNVLLYDHRGTGRSVRALTSPHTVEAMAEDMRIVLDAAEISRAHLVGHAAGGLAALQLGLQASDRVEKIVVINGWSQPDPHTARCFDARIALLKNAGPRAFVRAQPLFLYPATWISNNTQRLDEMEAHLVDELPPVDIILERIAALLRFDIDADLPKIAAPVLLSASADDMLVPVSCSEHLAARLPNATLDIMPWGGHAMSVTDPERFNTSLITFLRS